MHRVHDEFFAKGAMIDGRATGFQDEILSDKDVAFGARSQFKGQSSETIY